jgi:hypothetical protein
MALGLHNSHFDGFRVVFILGLPFKEEFVRVLKVQVAIDTSIGA